MTEPDWIATGFPQDAIAAGETLVVATTAGAVLLCRTSVGLHAVANRCTHAAAPLVGGRIRGHYLFCPAHGARFDLLSGAGSGLAQGAVATYSVEIRDGMIWVCI